MAGGMTPGRGAPTGWRGVDGAWPYSPASAGLCRSLREGHREAEGGSCNPPHTRGCSSFTLAIQPRSQVDPRIRGGNRPSCGDSDSTGRFTPAYAGL